MAREITIHELPGKDDILTKQYFSDCIEIRANMTGLTGSGKLLVDAVIVGSNDPTVKKIEAIYDRFMEFPEVESRH